MLVGSSLDVECEAKQRSRGTAVDVSSVKVQLFDSGGKPIDEAPLTAQGVDTFKGSVSLAKVPTGPVRVRCAAKDTTTGTALGNFAELDTYYDGGPTITFEGLDEKSIVPRGNDKVDGPEFTIKFKVDPAPLAANDPSAAVTNVTLSVRDTLVEPVKDGNAYSYAVDFKPLVGTTPIEELKILVTATNSRAPTAAVASKQLVVKVDSKPPVIVVTTPGDGT
ncbi:MAG TPA: hypothetical protein VFX59_18405, partial [Polyangiales bacterium]|nr:hypothetical protein [Polyangiales bacterium]